MLTIFSPKYHVLTPNEEKPNVPYSIFYILLKPNLGPKNSLKES